MSYSGVGGFFQELEPPKKVVPRPARQAGVRAPRSKGKPAITGNPCDLCPESANDCKAVSVVPANPLLAVVGALPEAKDALARQAGNGPGAALVRQALQEAGIDLDRVVYANLARCRPSPGKDTDAIMKKVRNICRPYLVNDLTAEVPLLLLGKLPLATFMDNNKMKEGSYRGLWVEARAVLPGRKAFVVRDPREVVQSDPGRALELIEDVRRMADRILQREAESKIKLTVFTSPLEAKDFLKWLAARTSPWVYDLESYDEKQVPGRKQVAVDPCHPDWRLRGIAIAVSAKSGYWIECKEWNDRIPEARELLSPAFESPADKGAFGGNFDEEGLVYPGWVRAVNNRRSDGLMALIALGDGTQDSLRLEKAVVDILGRPQYWSGFDKGLMKDLPLREVAANAVGDACYTFELLEVLHGKLNRAEYIAWHRKNIDGQEGYEQDDDTEGDG